MSKWTAIGKTLVKAADEAVPVVRAGDRVEPRIGDSAMGLDDYKTPAELEVEKAAADVAEAQRVERISPEWKDVDYNAQAATPEEFSEMVPRFGDPELSNNALNKGTGEKISSKDAVPFEETQTFKIQMKRWLKVQKPTLEVVLNNKGLIDWASEGAYTRGALFGIEVHNADAPVIWYRMDIRQDPRADLSPIQFDVNAREFGMHVGSRSSGQHILSPK